MVNFRAHAAATIRCFKKIVVRVAFVAQNLKKSVKLNQFLLSIFLVFLMYRFSNCCFHHK